jgi:hypothetical protein
MVLCIQYAIKRDCAIQIKLHDIHAAAMCIAHHHMYLDNLHLL